MRHSKLAAFLAVAAVGLAACGSGEDPRTSAEGNGNGTDTSSEGGSEPSDGGDTVTLTMESWRNDDLEIWEDTIIPAFEEAHPGIEVTFEPTAPDEYNAALQAKLDGGTAGDLVTCRPFDASLGLFDKGHLTDLSDLEGMENFDEVAKSAWTTDDGSATFCVPMASVIHGFIYNADAFAEVGVETPTTEAEFFELLDALEGDGTYTPLVMGTADQWEAATMGFQNIGPNYWQGEEGRKALIEGDAEFTDPEYVSVLETLARWADYLPDGYQSVTYSDAQNFFTLGKGAIYPAGSWEISLFNKQAEFEMGAFLPPPPADNESCYISDHTDIALGVNAASQHQEEAETFLTWLTTAEFAELYSNALPGFFSLSSHEVELEDPLAQEFVSWRQECESTIRNSYQILSRGEPNLENQLWDVSAQVINGTMEPQEAAETVQQGLESWYEPQQ